MALKKSTPEATKPEEVQKPEPTPEVELEKAPEPEPQAKAKPNKMTLVKNVARFDYVQPSTGVKVRTNQAEPTKVLDDQWVEQFVSAGLLERV